MNEFTLSFFHNWSSAVFYSSQGHMLYSDLARFSDLRDYSLGF